MPSLSGTFDPRIGPLVPLFLTPPVVLTGAIPPPGTATQPLAGTVSHPVNTVPALIDTGASITSVTAAIAKLVGLPLIGKRPLGTAGGTVAANVYLADVGIPFSALPVGPAGQALLAANVTTAVIPNVTILEFQCASPHFQMLLGRDILCSGIFHMGFDRRFTFSL